MTAFTLMRSSGVILWGFLQNAAHLARYGNQARTILDNGGVVQVWGARNCQMASDYSGLVESDVATIIALEKDEQLLLIEGGEPLKTKRLRYFAGPEFAKLYDASSVTTYPAVSPNR